MINTDQVGYIKGRYISQNVTTIEDIILYTNEYKIPGLIGLIDFEKAFDTVEWDFLFAVLKQFNLDPTFITWIKLLYTNIFSCTTNNGYLSNHFPLSRGIRQGCPILALLFILVAEVLSFRFIYCFTSRSTAKVILRWVVLQVEETIAYCTVNHRASASNYQLSNMKRPARDSNRWPQRLEVRTLTATPPSPLRSAVN